MLCWHWCGADAPPLLVGALQAIGGSRLLFLTSTAGLRLDGVVVACCLVHPSTSCTLLCPCADSTCCLPLLLPALCSLSSITFAEGHVNSFS